MCVVVEIEMPSVPGRKAGQLSKELQNRGLSEIIAQRLVKGDVGSRFLLGPHDHPCACGLGAGRVDERGEALSFDHANLGRIEATLRLLPSRAGPEGLRVRAYYADGAIERVPPPIESKSTMDKLVDTIRSDRLGDNVRYHVDH